MLKLIKKLLTFIRKNEMLKQASKQASKGGGTLTI